MPTRALLIVNRKSRNGEAAIDAALAGLSARGVEVMERPPERPGDIAALIRRHRDAVDCVVVGGGDGSLNAAAQALAGTGTPLGVLPMGTANDLARTLKIPCDLAKAADVIGTGATHRIDLGRVNGHYFFNAANIGLGVHVAHNLSPEIKKRWGVLGYARSLVSAARSFRPFHADILCDGRRRSVPSMQIVVGNGRYYGGGMTVSEDASIDDKMFFLYSIAPASWWELIKIAPAFRSGRFREQRQALIERGRRIEILTRRPKSVSADGEIVTHTPATFELVPEAITVFVPLAYFDDQQEAVDVAQG